MSQPSISVHTLDMEPASGGPQFVDLKQLENSSTLAAALQVNQSQPSTPIKTEDSQSSNGDSKAVKKRKSWGQELPEPTTNLPPRKRAKTEAEKEQRRIERVKRNRQAAHNSRERKRLEHEALFSEKDALESEVRRLADLNKKLMAEIAIYRSGQIPTSQVDTSQVTEVNPQQLMSPSVSAKSYTAPSSAQATPLLSNAASPPSDSAPYTPSLTGTHDFEQTQQSAVSFNFVGQQSCNNGGVAIGVLDSEHGYGMDNLFDMDFTLFDTNDNLNVKMAPPTPAQRAQNLTPVQPPSVSPISPFVDLGANPLTDRIEDSFGGSLFPDVHSSSGAAYASDGLGFAAGDL